MRGTIVYLRPPGGALVCACVLLFIQSCNKRVISAYSGARALVYSTVLNILLFIQLFAYSTVRAVYALHARRLSIHSYSYSRAHNSGAIVYSTGALVYSDRAAYALCVLPPVVAE